MLRSDSTGELLFSLGDETDLKEFFAELWQTSAGKDFADNYYVDDREAEFTATILSAVRRLYVLKNDHASVRQVELVLEKLLLAGVIPPHTPEEDDALEAPAAPVVDTTPRGKDGKPLTGSQLAWREFGAWSAAHSSSECKARARNDEAYSVFYRKQFEKEFASTEIGDAVVPAGEVPRSGVITAELRDFARQYAVEPSANLKPKGGLVTLNGRQISYEYFKSLLDQATACGAL